MHAPDIQRVLIRADVCTNNFDSVESRRRRQYAEFLRNVRICSAKQGRISRAARTRRRLLHTREQSPILDSGLQNIDQFTLGLMRL